LPQDRHVVAKANVLLSPPRESAPVTCFSAPDGGQDDAWQPVVVNQRDPRRDDLVHRDADREHAAVRAQARDDRLVAELGVAPQQDLPDRAGPADPGEQLVDEAQRAALGVGLALAQAHVQDLAGVGARGEDRMVAELSGVPVAGAMLGVTVDLAGASWPQAVVADKLLPDRIAAWV
jgi:hypothetical protein